MKELHLIGIAPNGTPGVLKTRLANTKEEEVRAREDLHKQQVGWEKAGYRDLYIVEAKRKR